MEKYYGNYLGLVINNQDPEGRDRVQIYVPGVTNTLYDNWNNNDTNKSIGMDIGSTFTLNEQILKKLKSVLPWAEKATPLIGPGCSVYQQSGGGSSILAFDGIQSSAFTPTSSNVNTSKGDRPDIDGYKMNDLNDNVYGVLKELKSAFPNKIVVKSAKRSWDEKKQTSLDSKGQPINSPKSSAHNSGNAFDISVKGLDIKDKKEITQFLVERGFNEIFEHGPVNHIHAASIPDQTKIELSEQPYMKEIEKDIKSGKITTGYYVPAPIIRPTIATAAHTDGPKQTIEGPTIVTKPATGIKSDYETLKSIGGGAGNPEGNRSTTRPLCRVWLFFYGGDVQKPVFFAYSLPPNETYAHNSVSAPNQTGSDSNGIVDPIVEPEEGLPLDDSPSDAAQAFSPSDAAQAFSTAIGSDVSIQESNSYKYEKTTDGGFIYSKSGELYLVTNEGINSKISKINSGAPPVVTRPPNIPAPSFTKGNKK